MKTIRYIAEAAYLAYCRQAGGKTFDGKPLPTFDELGADRQQCWEAAVKQVRTEMSEVL